MPFIRTVARVERWSKWRVALPLYDGRACPECGSVVVSRPDRQLHRDWHHAQTEWQSRMHEALRKTAVGAGLSPRVADDDDLYDGVRQVADIDYDDEENDERNGYGNQD